MYVVYVYELSGKEVRRYNVPSEGEANRVAYYEQCNGYRTKVAARQGRTQREVLFFFF